MKRRFDTFSIVGGKTIVLNSQDSKADSRIVFTLSGILIDSNDEPLIMINGTSTTIKIWLYFLLMPASIISASANSTRSICQNNRRPGFVQSTPRAGPTVAHGTSAEAPGPQRLCNFFLYPASKISNKKNIDIFFVESCCVSDCSEKFGFPRMKRNGAQNQMVFFPMICARGKITITKTD